MDIPWRDWDNKWKKIPLGHSEPRDKTIHLDMARENSALRKLWLQISKYGRLIQIVWTEVQTKYTKDIHLRICYSKINNTPGWLKGENLNKTFFASSPYADAPGWDRVIFKNTYRMMSTLMDFTWNDVDETLSPKPSSNAESVKSEKRGERGPQIIL